MNAKSRLAASNRSRLSGLHSLGDPVTSAISRLFQLDKYSKNLIK